MLPTRRQPSAAALDRRHGDSDGEDVRVCDGVLVGVPDGVADGVLFGDGVPDGVLDGVFLGDAQGIVEEVSGATVDGVVSVLGGVADGSLDGVTDAVLDGVPDAVADMDWHGPAVGDTEGSVCGVDGSFLTFLVAYCGADFTC